MAEIENDRAWAAEAKCLGKDPNFFFPVEKDPRTGLPIVLPSGAEKPDLHGIQVAKDFCKGRLYDGDTPCPVIHECLMWSIKHTQWDGVYAGMVERERRRIHRRKRASIGFTVGLAPPEGPGEVGVSSTD